MQLWYRTVRRTPCTKSSFAEALIFHAWQSIFCDLQARLAIRAAHYSRPEHAFRGCALNPSDLENELAQLPATDDPWFPIKLNELMFSSSVGRESLRMLLTDTGAPLDIRFKAFYGFLNRARRERDIGIYAACVRDFGPIFPEQRYPMVLLIRSQASLNYLQNGVYNEEHAQRALMFAKRCLARLPEHFGVASHFATVVSICESRNAREERDAELITRCIDMLETAIISSDGGNPKYHATRARLYMLLQKWDEGLGEISKAIDSEDSTLTDYSIRVGEYYLLRAEIEMDRRTQIAFNQALNQVRSVRDESVAIKKSVQDAQASTLTLVGLLAAIVAFITTTSSSLASLAINDALRVALVTSGSILVVFSTILWLVGPHSGIKASMKYLVAGIGGLLLAFSSLWLLP